MSASELRALIGDRRARVAIVGCGYVGLPLAMAFADAGYRVLGVDVDAGKIARLGAGDSYILDVSAETLGTHLRSGVFTPTTDFDVLRDADVVFVSVPTPFDRAKQPDLTFVISAAEQILPRLHRGQLIVLESTTFPGTTDEVLRPILERSGLTAGPDFFLAFSPERIDPGNAHFRIANTPKVVGGIDSESTALAVQLLEQVVTEGKVHAVSSTRAAEMTKLLENIFRSVNIALVNELAVLSDRMKIDLWEVIDAAATKPYGFMPFYPGPGVGGHCIPVDPYYLAWKAREFDFHTKFIELAAETNLEMPFFTAGRVRRMLASAGRPLLGARVLVIGASFKRDIDDARNSAAIRVMEILAAEGAALEYHDPLVPSIRLAEDLYAGGHGEHGRVLSSVPLTKERLAAADCVVILVGHSTVDYASILAGTSRVFDAVNVTRGLRGSAAVERL